LRVAIHTAATRDYLPGLRALCLSVKRSMPDVDIIVTADVMASELPDGCKIMQPSPALANIPEPGYAAYMNGYALTEYDRVVLLGADQIIVGDLSQVLDATADFAVIPAHGAGTYKAGHTYFATGMLSFKPYKGMIDEIADVCREVWSEPNPWGYVTRDEHGLNEWAHRNQIKPHYMPHYFDCSRRVFDQEPKTWNEWRDKIVSVHYLGIPKPWACYSNHPLDQLWRSYYDDTPEVLPCA